MLIVGTYMSKLAYTDAARMAGEVYGKILDREADRNGYEYVLDCLESGKKTVQQIVVDLIASDEFIDKFVAGNNASHTTNLLNKLLLGQPIAGEPELRLARRQFIRQGLRSYAEQIVRSNEYDRRVGANRVPTFGHDKRAAVAAH